MFKVKQLAVGGFDHNFSYLVVAENGDAVLIDPTGDVETIRAAVAAAGAITPRWILLTHGHLDHWEALGEAQIFFAAPVAAHPCCQAEAGHRLRNGEKLPFGDGFIEAIFTPGHSRDSVCYRLSDDSALFTGDTLFVGCVGFCRSKEMFDSLTRRIIPLNDNLMVYSGHDYGSVPCRTLGEEKRSNPYLRCPSLEDFKQEMKKLV
ncbi:MAG: MBL fold metallo-hydrolase [Victivallaceae bacterium]|nr:MBL fold metallo-hydrolase [Victivallaceae bacterium]